MKTRFLRRAGSLLLALALACSLLAVPAFAADDTDAVNVPLNSISLEPSGPLTLTPGGTEQLSILFEPANASNQNCTWTSSDPAVATVSGTGLITAQAVTAASMATITATAEDGGKTASCTVTVNPRVTGITITPSEGSIAAGETIALTAQIEPDAAADKRITWSCSNNRVLLSNIDGPSTTVSVPSGLNPGTIFNVVAQSAANPGVSDVCVIRVSEPLTPSVREVQITSPNTTAYTYVDPGTPLTLEATAYPADADQADRNIIWSSDTPSVATVNAQTGRITGVAPGKAVIRATASGDETVYAQREIEVSGILLSYLKRSPTGGRGETVSLTGSSTVDIYQNYDISVSVDPYGNARNKTITWESSNNSVAQALAGRVTASYPGEATITASVDGTDFRASFKVHVSEDVADAITVNMGSAPSYAFSGILSQLNARSQSKAGAPLDYVYSLRVSTENGVLYYRYTSSETPSHGVGGSENYYFQPSGQGQMALRDVTFVPLPGFSGTAVVDYNGVSTSGSPFTGTIRIEAAASSGGLSYSTQADQPIAFVGEHFSSVCKSRNGQALRYVTFTQPASSRGTLYYNYSPNGQFSPKVDSNTRYYLTSTPKIDNITFVPADGYVGNVEIPYRGVDSAGALYNGTVSIRVYGSGGQTGSSGNNVTYSLGLNQQRTLNAGDFNSASRWATGSGLSRIRFNSLPSSGAGTLYVNYTGSSSARVTTAASYYYDASPRISSITFVPAAGYAGTVSIPFTGTNTQGSTFSGSLIFYVGEGGGTGTVSYTTQQNRSAALSAWDFDEACRRVTGSTLNYIRFNSLPSSGAGTLYYGYTGSASSGSRVSVNTNYYRSGSPALSSVSFVPAAGYTGTVSIPFTGYDNDGSRFNGTLRIQVNGTSYVETPAVSTPVYTSSFSDVTSGWEWARPAIEYLRDNGITNGYRDNTFRPSQPISRGEFTLMVCRAFQFPTSGASGFPDVPDTSTYAGAIASARDLGIVQGNNGRFQPDQPITRQSAMTMICRALDAAGQSLPTADTALLSSFTDGAQVSSFARPSVAALVQLGAVRGNSAMRLNPGAAISRAEMAVILYRVLTR